ncbi:MAG: GNAT family N-acetyltransferase [Pseudomonadota bacterium]
MTHTVFNPRSPEIARYCAAVHAAEIPDGFLPSLGQRFLSLLYQHFARAENTFLVVALDDGDSVLGFLCGSLGTGGVYKSFVKAYGFRAVAALFPKLLMPSVLRRIFETLAYPSRTDDLELPDAEILNFCVRADSQGAGIGRALFEASMEAFRQRGVDAIRIVTGERQQSAQRFYEKVGASLHTTFSVHGQEKSLAYVYQL